VDDVAPSGQLRQAATILVFDLGGPLLAYALLRSAGLSAVAYGEHEKQKAERLAGPLATAGHPAPGR
jgi:hypothetical protein